MSYNDNVLAVIAHVIDRRLWTDSSPTAAELPDWDAVSVFVDTNGNTAIAPGTSAYRFELEVSSDFQTTAKGNGSSWTLQPLTLSAWSDWRGLSGPNSGSNSEGWVARFYIPYATFGLGGPPPPDTQWGLALVLHDRDDSAGTIKQDTLWPETMDPNSPATWGKLAFGVPTYAPPSAIPAETHTIRNGLSGEIVVDGSVGGYMDCGNNGTDKWTTWGDRNYSDPSVNYQFNVQNQWDIADWPCFSKYYVTFPLVAKPPDRVLLTASLTLHLRGTAGGGPWGPPPDSYLEIFTVSESWQPSTLTWNNAPMALENISGAWVEPIVGAYSWNVSLAVAQAYASGTPLQLAVYSIDGGYHTGKYFYSSSSTDWGETIRPTLTLTFARPCSSPGVTCHFTYLPITGR